MSQGTAVQASRLFLKRDLWLNKGSEARLCEVLKTKIQKGGKTMQVWKAAPMAIIIAVAMLMATARSSAEHVRRLVTDQVQITVSGSQITVTPTTLNADGADLLEFVAGPGSDAFSFTAEWPSGDNPFAGSTGEVDVTTLDATKELKSPQNDTTYQYHLFVNGTQVPDPQVIIAGGGG